MNCTLRILPHLRDRPDRLAISTLRGGRASFADIGQLAGAVQSFMQREGLRAGDPVLVLAQPSPLLYGTLVGLLGQGLQVLFVEPWLPVSDIEHILATVQPRAFIGSRAAQLWALRVPGVRRIPRWVHVGRFRRARGHAFEPVDVASDQTATITFSSGTTGRPKGVVRSHECMASLQEAVVEAGSLDAYEEPALCVFPNLALLHLGTGRGGVLVPGKWSRRNLQKVAAEAGRRRVASLTTGPAFLLHLLRTIPDGDLLPGLRTVMVGGAQTDRWILERCFERWPETRWIHLYGSSEAEPVAVADARRAVQLSEERGLFQTLFVGAPVPVIEARPEPAGLRVRGPNVATRLGDLPSVDWLEMGDRITVDDAGWWYGGRASQPGDDFDLEQRLYSFLETSACFVTRDADGRLCLCGEGVECRVGRDRAGFASLFPEIQHIVETPIVRDRRHRARIDRRATLASLPTTARIPQ